jgi:hypothetical protein
VNIIDTDVIWCAGYDFHSEMLFSTQKVNYLAFLANFSKMADFRKIPNNMNISDTDVIWCATDDFHSEMLFENQKFNHLAVFG